jgi:hypothetical protein
MLANARPRIPSCLLTNRALFTPLRNITLLVLCSIYSLATPLTPLPHPEYDVVQFANAVIIERYKGPGGHVVIPAAFDNKPPTHLEYGAFDSFNRRTNILSITIPASITNIDGRAFIYCHSLTNFFVDPSNPAYSAVGGIIFDKTGAKLLHYPPGRSGAYNTSPSTTDIGPMAFTTSPITEIAIGESIVSVGDNAFYECENLSKAALSDSVHPLALACSGPVQGSPTSDFPTAFNRFKALLPTVRASSKLRCQTP